MNQLLKVFTPAISAAVRYYGRRRMNRWEARQHTKMLVLQKQQNAARGKEISVRYLIAQSVRSRFMRYPWVNWSFFSMKLPIKKWSFNTVYTTAKDKLESTKSARKNKKLLKRTLGPPDAETLAMNMKEKKKFNKETKKLQNRNLSLEIYDPDADSPYPWETKTTDPDLATKDPADAAYANTDAEMTRKKEKAMISELEKACAEKISHLEESLKKKKQDDKTFNILRKTLGSFLGNGSDEDFPPED